MQHAIQQLFEDQKRTFAADPFPDLAQRLDRLSALKTAVETRRQDMQRAMYSDFGKPAAEVDATEFAPVIIEINYALRHLGAWLKPERRPTPRYLPGMNTQVQAAPKGVSLVLSPWNFAFNLTLGPLVHALAAGCPVILKPSELAPRAATLIQEIIESVFEPREVAVLQGGPPVAVELLQLPFRHIYFTGSARVGRKVMAAAASHLASVTLELGGKSPAYVGDDADLEASALSLAFAKFINAGQTCIAPDYALVHARVFEDFVAALSGVISESFGADPATSPDFARIVTTAHAERLRDLLDEAVEAGAKILAGDYPPSRNQIPSGGENPTGGHTLSGDHSPSGSHTPSSPQNHGSEQPQTSFSGRYFAPTVITGVPDHCQLMQEEIFGPILPLIPVDSPEDALRVIQSHEPPLCAYVFSDRPETAELFGKQARIGAICQNESLVQFANPWAPFGGLGSSGIGRSHGKAGFMEFSVEQTLMRRRFGGWLTRRLYPPYTPETTRWIDWLLRLS